MAIQIHEKKLDRQLLGLNRWRNAKNLGISHSNGWGVLWWETGVGKTYASLLLANKMLEVNNSNTFVIICPATLIKQWKDEINNHIKSEYKDNFRVFSINKIMELINESYRIECSLLIVDELHECYTEERLKIFNGDYIITKYCLGLTADYEDVKGRQKAIEYRLPVVDRITPEEAEREGFTSKYIEYNLAVDFTEQERENYRVFTDVMTKNLSKFGKGGLDLANKILSGNKEKGLTGIQMAYAYATHHGWRKDMDLSIPSNNEINNLWHPSKIMGYAKASMDAIRDRKTIIYCTIGKIKVARDLAIKFEDLKTIFFSQSTAFADVLARTINKHYDNGNQLDHIPCVVYHSKIQTIIETDPVTGKQKKKGKTVLKREAIEAIRSGKARRISTASSLDKGFDVKDIRMGVTTSGTQNPIQYHQRSGRPKRKEDEDVVALIINLYTRNSIDETWVRKRQSKSSSIVYWVDSIDDINYTPKDKESFNLIDI